jgi:hypothetical protein
MLDITLVLGVWVVVVTAVVLLIFRRPWISKLFLQYIPDQRRRRMFLAAIGFFLTFGVARALAFMNYNHIGPFHDIYIDGRHIHHLVWGILLLLSVGYGWLNDVGTKNTPKSIMAGRLMALLYGAGAALTLDEFALWLNLQDVYWTEQGRASLDAVVLFGALLLIGVRGRAFFRAVGRETLRLFRRRNWRP